MGDIKKSRREASKRYYYRNREKILLKLKEKRDLWNNVLKWDRDPYHENLAAYYDRLWKDENRRILENQKANRLWIRRKYVPHKPSPIKKEATISIKELGFIVGEDRFSQW